MLLDGTMTSAMSTDIETAGDSWRRPSHLLLSAPVG